jgi:CSLREA domain-containing protein
MLGFRRCSLLIRTLIVLVAVLSLALAVGSYSALRANPSSFAVTSTTDAGDANPGNGLCATMGGECTLRAAVQEANALGGDNTIVLPAGVFTLTIPGADEDAAATGDLDITANLSIAGIGPSTTIIDGGGLDRVIHIPLSTTVAAISDVTIQHGDAGVLDGGGVYNLGILQLANSAVVSNTAVPSDTVRWYAGGGGIRNDGSLTLITTTVHGNTTGVIGGGISSGGLLTLTHSVVAYNHSAGGSGGIFNFGSMTISNSTVSDNSAEITVGGLGNSGILTLTNSTVTHNYAQQGMGGISNESAMSVRHTVISYNYSSLGSEPSDCGGLMTSLGHNLTGSNYSCFYQAQLTDRIGVDPLLGPLADNGGSTVTRLPLGGSPAINSGGNEGCPATDQRGIRRPQAGVCDIGAVEVEFLHATYLPLIIRPVLGIYGLVTDHGLPVAGVSLALQRATGSVWSTLDSAYTQGDGSFAFIAAPSLAVGQRYAVRFSGGTSDRLGYWSTRALDTYAAGSTVHIGDFDIANIELLSPSNGSTVSLPHAFQWTPRPAVPSDSYKFFMTDGETYHYSAPLGFVGSFTLTTLPAGFSVSQPYYWGIYVFRPDGSYGMSHEGRQITFTHVGLLAQQPSAVGIIP